MTQPLDPRPLLAEALDRARQRPALAAELLRAQREFFGGAMPEYARDPVALAAAEARFAEWFVIERESDTLAQVPAAELLGGADLWWEDSEVGIYKVERHLEAVMEVQDLQTAEKIEVEAAEALAEGTLVVGRIYGTGPGWWSPSSVVHAGTGALAKALKQDLSGLQIDRRLTQSEIEKLVFRHLAAPAPEPALAGDSDASADEPLERLEAKLDSLFEQGEFDEIPAEEVCAALAAADSPAAVAGPLLEQVAFHSSVDIPTCQDLLNRIWQVQRKKEAPVRDVPPGATPRLGADLVRHLEDGLAGQRDLETVFAEMARMAGIDPAELDEDDDPGSGLDDGEAPSAATFDDLSPLVQEFLWETGDDPVSQDVLGALVQLTAALPVAVTQFDDLTSEHFLRLMLQGWLGAPASGRVAEVLRTQSVLERFLDWARDHHEMDRTAALALCRPAFVNHMERMARAADALGTEGAPTRPGLWRVDDILPGKLGLRRDEDGEHLLIPSQVGAEFLETGDLLVGDLRLGEGAAPHFHGMVVVLPSAAEGLLG